MEAELAPHQIIVVADEIRVKQVLLNLATNALKFTNEGCVTMTARVVSSADAARMAIVLPSNTNFSDNDTGDSSAGLLYQTYGDSSDVLHGKGIEDESLRATYPVQIPSTIQTASVVVVEVTDSGCGLKPADYERVFSRFFTKQGEDNLRGFGLGLPISNELVRASVRCALRSG